MYYEAHKLFGIISRMAGLLVQSARAWPMHISLVWAAHTHIQQRTARAT